jgi:hypothetical protein
MYGLLVLDRAALKEYYADSGNNGGGGNNTNGGGTGDQGASCFWSQSMTQMLAPLATPLANNLPRVKVPILRRIEGLSMRAVEVLSRASRER